MVDRTDIDALLIGALYGELTPADEARLMAHLESHPVDRTALDNLTRTRAAVRDSRILAFQAEPPQSISALLLQEASRRAPRAATERSETATWFQRFVRSFMAHPAMAAAATLVLVIAAVGTFYLRGADQFAQSEPPALERATSPGTTASSAPAGVTAPGAPAAVAPAPEPEAAGAGNATGDSIGTLAGSSRGLAAGSGVYPARLDDTAAAKGKAAEPQAASNDRYDGSGDLDTRGPSVRAKVASKAAQDAELRKLGAMKAAAAKTEKAEAVHGIELRTPQLLPKDFKESDKASDDEKPAAGRRERTDNGRAAGEPTRDPRNAPVAGGGAAAAVPAAPPPPPSAPAPAASRGAGPAGAANFDLPEAQAAPANDVRRPAAKPSANQQPPSSASNATNAQANADAARQAQLLDWARKQRDQVIALVNANRCRDAASVAVDIYNRAPEYFNANVVTDRQIKPCLAYVNDQRDRAERSRANKNAADVQTPAQAAPTRK